MVGDDALDEPAFGGVQIDGDRASASKPDGVSDGYSSHLLDAVASLLAAPDPQSFLGGLIGALSQPPIAAVGKQNSIEIARRLLGHGIARDLDETAVFGSLVGALDRKNVRSEALRASIPIVAAFLARTVSEPIRVTRAAATTPADFAAVVQAAAQIASETLDNHGARGWQTLPHMAAAVADCAAEQGLSLAGLAEALPQLARRIRANQQHLSASGRSSARVEEGPRRIILNGPVEIVILGR